MALKNISNTQNKKYYQMNTNSDLFQIDESEIRFENNNQNNMASHHQHTTNVVSSSNVKPFTMRSRNGSDNIENAQFAHKRKLDSLKGASSTASSSASSSSTGSSSLASKPLKTHHHLDDQNSSFSSISSSSTNCSTGSSSIQIRTSSPISSSTSSSQTDLFNPLKELSKPPVNLALYNQKRQQKSSKMAEFVQARSPKFSKHVSIKDLAYEKLRQQQLIETQFRSGQPEQAVIPPCGSDSQKYLRSNGKLKIAAYNNVGHLTLHIIKGRDYRAAGLTRQHEPIGDTYVKINMLPDLEQRFSQCQTAIAKSGHASTHSTVKSINYDEKFSFEFDSVDFNNRLVISVWQRVNSNMTSTSSLVLSSSSSASSSSSSVSSSSSSNASTLSRDYLIGCFSFRIKNLMSFTKNLKPQWYHLLPEQFGLSKHLRCRQDRQQMEQQADQPVRITNVNKDLIGLERIKIAVMRSNENESYGFTVTGNCPCMIGKVDLNKNAFLNGLRPGDYISSINGRNVSRATTESVVKLIKSCKTNLDIEVYRETTNATVAAAAGVVAACSTASTKSKQIVSRDQIINSKEFNLPKINLPNQNQQQQQSSNIYQTIPHNQLQQQVTYGLESVPEEDENDNDDLANKYEPKRFDYITDSSFDTSNDGGRDLNEKQDYHVMNNRHCRNLLIRDDDLDYENRNKQLFYPTKQQQQQQPSGFYPLSQANIDSIRFVDSTSSSTSSSTDNLNCLQDLNKYNNNNKQQQQPMADDSNDVESLRRAAAKFYNNGNPSGNNGLMRQANIMSLKSLKINSTNENSNTNNFQYQQTRRSQTPVNYHLTATNFNQFI